MVEANLREKARTVPTQPGVYLWKDPEGAVLYVGMSGNLRDRVAQYFQIQEEPRRAELMEKATDVQFIAVDSIKEALLLEQTLIKRHTPPYNVLLVDDKKYPYIAVLDEDWPRIVYTRNLDLKGSFFGPFPDAWGAKRLARVLNQSLQLRQCRTLPKRECLYYHMHQCSGPCIGAVTKEAYGRQVATAKTLLRGGGAALKARINAEMDAASSRLQFEQAAQLRDLGQAVESVLERQGVHVEGGDDYDALGVASLKDRWCVAVEWVRRGAVVGQGHYFLNGPTGTPAPRVLTAFLEQLYLNVPEIPPEILLPVPLEEAASLESVLSDVHERRVRFAVPERGARRRFVELAERNAQLLLEQEALMRERQGPQGLDELAKALALDEAPQRIECFDISHSSGQHTVASMVVLEGGKPKKSDYRKFKVRTTSGGDDPGAMREVVGRRYARVLQEEGVDALPDLVVVDGGRTQVAAAFDALKELGLDSLPLVGLAKRLEEIYQPRSVHPIRLDAASPALHVLQRARDEAHRFAIGFQGQLKRKEFLHSSLDDIPGVGPERRRRLLTTFGSLDELREATPEAIAKVPGIPKALAQRIHAALTGSGNAPS